MKRNRFGMNFDLGLPLESDSDFKALYIPVQKEAESKLTGWVKSGEGPLLIGGQIGSGKSTIIQNVWHSTCLKPDMELHFDTEAINLSIGDFWRIILSALIKKALKENANLSPLKLPEELAGLGNGDWHQLVEILSPSKVSLALYSKRRELQGKFVDILEYIEKACSEILKIIEEAIQRKCILFASGVDKHAPDSAAFFDLRGPLKFLLSHKTLFELNVTHLFHPIFSTRSDQWLIIHAMQENKIRQLLQKRMGVYSTNAVRIIGIATKWSGGNPRQALRMLIALRNTKGKTQDEIIIGAVRTLFLEYFAYSPKPEDDLLNVIKQQGYLEPALLSLPGDKETAQRAIQNNWLLLQKADRNGAKLRTIVNPIVVYSVALKVRADDPEVRLLKRYAKQKQIGNVGLDFDKDVISLDIWKTIFGTKIEQPIVSNLTEILEILRSSLLSKDRADRIIVAYRNLSILNAARAYLFAKANTYEFQSFKHVTIMDSREISPVIKLLELLQENVDILSIEFGGGEWNEKSLIEIDKIRDNLLQRQMIWWIPEKSLSRYLHYWVQLRQLFQVVVLEDELLSSLTIEDIESDINLYKDLTKERQGSESNVVNNLEVVLGYLKQVMVRGSNG